MRDASVPTIREAAALIAQRELSPLDLTKRVLRRLQDTENAVHAYVTVCADQALAEAQKAEREIAISGVRGPLHGIPVNLKDLFLTKGIRTEAGSDVLRGHVPSVDSAVAERLKSHGAIIIGKTVTHEFGYGMNLVPTRNPWDLDYYPGGSSAGAGASVAVGSALAAIGTDTGGSLRLPAAMTGVAAMKPTTGRVSKRGVIPLVNSMVHCGPMARTVEDVAIVLSAICGFDPGDASSARKPVPDFAADLTKGVQGLRIGIERGYYFGSGDPDVLQAVDAAIQVLVDLGAEIVEIHVRELELAAVVAETIILAEASGEHQTSLRDSGERYDARTRLRLEVGELILATDYLRAQKLRQQLRQRVKSAFVEGRLDALVGPTLGTPPIRLDELPARRQPSPTSPGLPWLRYTAPYNLTGQPALTVNCGYVRGLPIGMQIAGRPFDEATVLRVGHAYQQATRWHQQLPVDPPRTS